jgi:hypothetical protein
MATGDSGDMLSRLKSLLPRGWFADGAPIRDAVLGGIADSLAWIYGFIIYAKLQTRLATATAPFLDIASLDFFGTSLPRRNGERDPAFSARIRAEITRERQTRNAIVTAVTGLTGRPPFVIEPANPADTAIYGIGTYYGQAGIYGSLLLRNQVFVVAYRPQGAGIANVAGYGRGYYGAPISRYVDQAEIQGPVLDADIYATIAKTVAAGVTAWVEILNNPIAVPTGGYSLNYSVPQDSELLPGLVG